ncbi:hypothetical protein [Pedobacter frigoris]|uniref:hypothetical protein n=1 Tax=Pedobacter frigoris TaxID=2571272 RepID=UPI00292FF8DE|nr:hypothetical protein [Pedobacter frigoris]
MKTFIMNRGLHILNLLNEVKKEHRLVMLLVLGWELITRFFSSPEISTGINQSVPIMIVIAIISFLIVLELIWWLLGRFWLRMGLVSIDSLVEGFKTLTVWEQVIIFWGSFALLLLACVGCLAAVL